MVRKILAMIAIVSLFLTNISLVGAQSNANHSSEAAHYLKQGYRPFLEPSYKFPLKIQTRNGCYFYSVRNIVQYKYKNALDVEKFEKEIGKDRNKISTVADIQKFNTAAGIEEVKFRTMRSFFENLQKGEPLIISYILKSKDKKGNWVEIPHLVAAYSFDEHGIWIADSLSGKRKRIPFDEVFKYGRSKYNAMRKVSLKED